jgi:hypothetical protein
MFAIGPSMTKKTVAANVTDISVYFRHGATGYVAQKIQLHLFTGKNIVGKGSG